MFFDPMYLLFLAPGMLLAMWAQWKVHSAYEEAKQYRAASGYSGAETAAAIIRQTGMEDVRIEPVQGMLSDHYDPSARVLRLSPEVFSGRSLAALGIAAHEAGHALQDAQGYPLLKLRNGIVPLAMWGGNLSMIIFFVGMALMYGGMALGKPVLFLGIGLFSLTVIFQLVNLPVEFDASRRAKILLADMGLVAPGEEQAMVRKVLSAAAMTYVAATISAILTLLYLIWRSGLLNSRD
ncbi:MAG: zinc metallopeptidase [Gemmataceae bacterium]